MAKKRKYGEDPLWIERWRKIHPFKVFIWIAMTSIAIIFIFFGLSFILTNHPGTFYIPRYFTFSTVVLIVSSFSLAGTISFFRRDNLRALHTRLLISFFLAQLFIYSQCKGWGELHAQGIFLNGEASGSYLYLISGLHLVHFIGGLIFLFFVYIKVYQAYGDPVRNVIYVTDPYELMKLQLLNTYWQFLDILWLVMFFIFFFSSK